MPGHPCFLERLHRSVNSTTGFLFSGRRSFSPRLAAPASQKPALLRWRLSRAVSRLASLDALFLLAVLFAAISYWIVSSERRPAEPRSVTAIYRAGDIEYYPFIAGLSRFRLTESVVRECDGGGVVRFLFWSCLPHGLCLRLFGPGGFAVMDVLGFVGFYLACVWMLRRLAVTGLLARTAALLILAGAASYLEELVGSLAIPQRYHLSPEFWGLRIPRPFVSSIPLCVCAAMFLRLLLQSPRDLRGRWWGAYGACLAILLQADPYQAGTIAISTAMVVAVKLGTAAANIRSLVKGVAIGVAALVFFAVPFMVQWGWGSADSARRLGVFPVDRLHPLWLPYPNFTYLRVAWIAAACGAGLNLRTAMARERAWTYLGLTGLCTASYLALPLTCVVFGKTVQVYHFEIAFHTWVYLTIVVVLLHALERAGRALGRVAVKMRRGEARLRAITATLVTAVLVASVVAALDRGSDLAGKTGPMRPDFPEWRSLNATYRRDFAGLVGELSRSEYREGEVAGTFDHQVYAWWTTFRGGYCFVPDAGLSTLTDSAMEDRVIALCRCVGMDRLRFEEFFHRRYVSIFWLGHAKYQASATYTFRPESDYTPEQQRQISKTGMGGTWNSLIPKSETARLLDKFDGASGVPLPGRLDFIVLTKDEGLLGLAPSDRDFAPVYSNDTFAVWRRQGPP